MTVVTSEPAPGGKRSGTFASLSSFYEGARTTEMLADDAIGSAISECGHTNMVGHSHAKTFHGEVGSLDGCLPRRKPTQLPSARLIRVKDGPYSSRRKFTMKSADFFWSEGT